MIHIYVYAKMSLILAVIGLGGCVIDKHKASLTVKWLFRVASLHNTGPGRSVMLPEVVNRRQVCLHFRQENTWKKRYKKSVTPYR